MIVIADTIGLTILGGFFGLTIFVLWPIADIPPLLFFFVYLALAAASLYVWHADFCPLSPADWIRWILGSILGGAIFFVVDMGIGHFSYPDLPLLEAGTKAGGAFGFGATLAVCPGGTFVALAGLVRSYFASR